MYIYIYIYIYIYLAATKKQPSPTAPGRRQPHAQTRNDSREEGGRNWQCHRLQIRGNNRVKRCPAATEVTLQVDPPFFCSQHAWMCNDSREDVCG